METKKTQTNKFLVLVPHRDIRVELKKYCDFKLKEGLTGVYNFPLVTPIASLSQALNDGELKQIANLLRKSIGKNKISAGETSAIAFSYDKKELSLYGKRLDITPQDISLSGEKKINYIFPSFVIGCFLKDENNAKLDILNENPQKKLEFRAAAVANMYWKTLQDNGEIYFKWKIGKLFWLPRP